MIFLNDGIIVATWNIYLKLTMPLLDCGIEFGEEDTFFWRWILCLEDKWRPRPRVEWDMARICRDCSTLSGFFYERG